MSQHRWSGWGASVRGPGHRAAGLPNQDALLLRRFRAGFVGVVSDGIGSCPHAEVGARAACHAVLEAASFCFRHALADLASLPRLVQPLWERLLREYTPAECSATCLFVVAHEGDRVLVAQLGDGLIAACRGNGEVELFMPDKSESFANLTAGLASHQAAGLWRTSIVPADQYCAFVLCTDGIAEDLEPAAIRAFAWEVASHYRHYARADCEREVRRWLDDWPVLGHSDDKTIACIYQSEGANE